MALLNSVRILLSLAVNVDWELHLIDVKNTFLYGDLVEDVYMGKLLRGEYSVQIQKTYRLKQS